MDTSSLIIRMIGALALILGLMFILVFFLRKWGGLAGRTGTGFIEVVENRPLLPKRHVSLVRVAGNYFLIGSTEQGMSLLGKIRKDDMEGFEKLVRENKMKQEDREG